MVYKGEGGGKSSELAEGRWGTKQDSACRLNATELKRPTLLFVIAFLAITVYPVSLCLCVPGLSVWHPTGTAALF